MNPEPTNHNPSLWKRSLRLFWRGRFIYLQLAVLAMTAWALWPLRDAASLPNPPLPAYTPAPPDRQELLVIGSNALTSGAPGSIRAILYDPGAGRPLPGAEMRVALSPLDGGSVPDPIFVAQTGAQGTALAHFDVPANARGQYNLVVDVAGPVGAQQVIQPVVIERRLRLDLNTDNVRYHPGQSIYVRLFAGDEMTGAPLAGCPLTWSLFDARENLLWSETLTTTEYGLATASFALAEQISPGAYRVVAALNAGDLAPITAEQLVDVELDTPPLIYLDIQLDRPYYLYGQRVQGTVQAADRWKRPISGTQFLIRPQIQGAAPQDLPPIAATGSETGALSFAFDLPAAQGRGQTALTLAVQAVTPDGWRAVERRVQRLIAAQAIDIRVFAESTQLKPGLDNIVYLRAMTLDGRPARCTLTVAANGAQVELETDSDGLAQWHYLPAGDQAITLQVTAQSADGQTGAATANLSIEPGLFHLLLRPTKTVYDQGDKIEVDLLAPNDAPALYLDLFSAGTLFATYDTSCIDGHGHFTIDAAPPGALILHAYALLADGSLVQDARPISILPARRINVHIQAGRQVYAPGERAIIDLQITRATGPGVPGALSVAVIGATDRMLPTRSEPPQMWFDPAGRAASAPPRISIRRAGVLSRPKPAPAQIKRQFSGVAAARAHRRAQYVFLSARLVVALAGLAALLSLVVLLQTRRLESPPTAGFWLKNAPGGLLVFPFAALGAILMAHFGPLLFGPGFALVLGLSWLGILTALAVFGWDRRDGWAQTVPALLVAALALGWGLCKTLAQDGMPGAQHSAAFLSALVLASTSLYILGLGLRRRRAPVAAGAAFAAMCLLIAGAIGVVLSAQAAHVEQPPIPDLDIDLSAVQADAPPPFAGTVALPPAQSLTTLWAAPRPGWETLYWQPAVTDEQGKAALDIPVDATSRLVVLASTRQGEQGVAQIELNVYTPLSIDALLPDTLTAGDELAAPIMIRNHAAVSQTIHLTIAQNAHAAPLFPEIEPQVIQLPPLGVGALVAPLSARQPGQQSIEITASVAGRVITHPVRVLPDGKPIVRRYNRQTGETDTYKIRIPWSARPDTALIAVKIYPGWASMLQEGLQSALAHKNLDRWVSHQVFSPTQVSTPALYPTTFSGDTLTHLVAETRHLALLRDRLAAGGRLSPPLDAQIKRAAAANYQHLLAFEAGAGGFSLLGRGDGDLVQTASTLFCLSDLAGLTWVDPQVVDHAARWLIERQTPGGMWRAATLPPGWERLPRPELPFTAYIAWALIDAGYGGAPATKSAVEHLARYADQAQDAYTLALTVHALVAYRAAAGDSTQDGEIDDAVLARAVSRLIEMAEMDEDRAIWRSGLPTFDGAVGAAAEVEQTALAVWALLRARPDVDAARQGLAALAYSRDAFGAWGSPTATHWALRALAAAVDAGWQDAQPSQAATVRVAVGALRSDKVDLSESVTIPAGSDKAVTVYVFNFDDLAKGYNDVRIEVQGGPIFYQLVAGYVLPWSQAPLPSPEEEVVSLAYSFDRAAMGLGETITATVGVMLNRPGVAPLVVLNLGLPPGAALISAEWDRLLQENVIAGYRQAGGQMRVYLTNLSAEQPLNFHYHLQGVMVAAVQTQPTWAFDLANPGAITRREPAHIRVIKKPGR